jgi:hypothetical protein
MLSKEKLGDDGAGDDGGSIVVLAEALKTNTHLKRLKYALLFFPSLSLYLSLSRPLFLSTQSPLSLVRYIPSQT